MNEQNTQIANLDQAVQNALALMQKPGLNIKTKFKNYSHLKCTAKLRYNHLQVFASKAYSQTTQEVLNGLVLHVLLRLFKFKQKRFAKHLVEYRKFVASKQAKEISKELAKTNGRIKQNNAFGQAYDLHRVAAKVLFDHGSLLKDTLVPELSWSNTKSRRLLARHDEHSNRIVVSKLFDSINVPQFVVEYLVYHELLHAKWGIKFNETNFARKIHSKQFKDDEKKFIQYRQAIDWINKNLRYLR